jgi:hypothetical protein
MIVDGLLLMDGHNESRNHCCDIDELHRGNHHFSGAPAH